MAMDGPMPWLRLNAPLLVRLARQPRDSLGLPARGVQGRGWATGRAYAPTGLTSSTTRSSSATQGRPTVAAP